MLVDDYVAWLDEMAEELQEAKEVREAVNDDDLSLVALNDLDESYDPFVTTESTRTKKISFASFLGQLRTYKKPLH